MNPPFACVENSEIYIQRLFPLILHVHDVYTMYGTIRHICTPH